MLTRRQRDCLEAIVRLTDGHGRCPSYREIAAELGNTAHASTHRMVWALVERGYVTIDDGRKRSIRVIGRERVFAVRKGEDGDAFLVEYPAPGQKRPANGREHVGRHEKPPKRSELPTRPALRRLPPLCST